MTKSQPLHRDRFGTRDNTAMSALGQKQTFALQKGVSALGH
jgi:hypothetical protein